MSGHSHWAGIKHKKGLADAKRSQTFSKLAKELTIAAKDGGVDPEANPRLRTVIEKARAANMPSDNVERAIKKASGSDEAQLEEILIEAYGPEGIALLINAITDNRNRTIGEIKQILNKHQGKMVEGGAVRWLFELRGVISIGAKEDGSPALPKEDLELLAIEAGAEDLYWQENNLDLYVSPQELEDVKKKIEAHELSVNTSLDWVPKEHVKPSESARNATEALFEALDEQEDVQDMYSNLS